ncbi:MAG: DUF3048 domain-containing protein [Chloroflexi bacterium]|nr:DUF3048 domain-containing protein [Chloroflexota bacterium]
MPMKCRFCALWGFFLLLMAACQQVTPTAEPLPTLPPTVTGTATAVNTPTATSAPSATATPPPPPATPTPLPTAAPSPTPTDEVVSAAEPAQTATPIQQEGWIGPYTFPPNTNPLTGLPMRADLLAQRPLAIKISNYPPLVRPQYGLGRADLLFEHYAEGSATRFTAVFYSQGADLVGSVRSGRLIDLEIPMMYDAAFAYSGASGPVRLRFRDSPFFGRIISPDFAHGGFERIPEEGKALEHTLYTNTDTLRYLLDERGENHAPTLANHMAFSAEPPEGGAAVSRFAINYIGTYANWFYQAGTNQYLRWTDGEPHLDAGTEEQLSFSNVIVVGAHHQETDIIEDVGGNLSIQIQLWGEGPVSIFRNGQRFEGVWRRTDPSHMLTFYDKDGNILPLTPGTSFFHIVPLGFTGLVEG